MNPTDPTEPTAKAPKVQVSLKDREKAVLWAWLQTIRERIVPEKLYPKKLAAMGAESLKMPQLNNRHVRHALGVLSLPVVRSPYAGTDRQTTRRRYEDRIASLETRCDQLEQRCLLMEGENAALVKLVEETAARIEAKARECATGTRHAPPVLRGGVSSTNRT